MSKDQKVVKEVTGRAWAEPIGEGGMALYIADQIVELDGDPNDAMNLYKLLAKGEKYKVSISKA